MKKVINLNLDDELVIRVNNKEVMLFTPKGKVQDTGQEMIQELGLGTRLTKCLRNAGIHTISQLIEHTEVQVLKIPDVGIRSLKKIKEALAERGKSLKDSSYSG